MSVKRKNAIYLSTLYQNKRDAIGKTVVLIRIFTEKSSCAQSGELCPNLPKCPIPHQKNNVDNKAHFSYQQGYYLC
jgi:hypothetical protein